MRLKPHQRAQVQLLLRRGDEGALDRAHELSRNDGDLHARVHLGYARLAVLERRPRALRAELWQALMAPVASLVRRRAGYRPEEPNTGGLLQTWSNRR